MSTASHQVEGGNINNWSFIDNFEWDKGIWPQFGLVKIDRKTMKRTVRESGKLYFKIVKDNAV